MENNGPLDKTAEMPFPSGKEDEIIDQTIESLDSFRWNDPSTGHSRVRIEHLSALVFD